MHEFQTVRRKLAGAGDVTWIAFVFFTALVVTTLLLGHLRDGFELYRLGNRIAYAAGETRALENDRRSLAIELQHRQEAVDVWGAAESLGLEPTGEEQIVTVEVQQ